jgi:ketosteroid isomerase-like protein
LNGERLERLAAIKTLDAAGDWRLMGEAEKGTFAADNPRGHRVGLERKGNEMWKLFIAKFGMRSLGLVAMLIACPANADEAMTVFQDLASNWQNAWNSGDAKKLADLYAPDAIFSSGVLGLLKGRAEIEKALAEQMKKTPKITLTPILAHQNGNVIYGYWDFMLPEGPSGHGGTVDVKDGGTWHIAMHVSNVTPPKKQ